MKVARRIAYDWRRRLVLGLFLLVGVGLIGRAVQLQTAEQEFLQAQGESRQLRTVPIPASRGMLMDRNGEALAISTPVQSVWAVPARALEAGERLAELARELGLSETKLEAMLRARLDRQFAYLRRQLPPDQAARVRALGLPGVSLSTEYRRYYPSGVVVAPLLGSTDIDDNGREGLELALDERLRAQPGVRQVRQDRHGQIIDDIAQLRAPKHGENLQLSIDLGLQSLVYRELEGAVRKHRAKGAVAVVLDVVTGEVLAMAQVPSFNPNDRSTAGFEHRRNRAITDVYEPGSVVKPFTALAALASGDYQTDSEFETFGGEIKIGRYTISDFRDFGTLDMSGMLVKSSNVAAAQLAMGLPPDTLWETLDRVGFGQTLGLSFPGQAAGVLRTPDQWGEVEQASLGYGYGLSVTPLHIAHAYMVLGNRGIRQPLSFLARPDLHGQRVLSRKLCETVLGMLEHTSSPGGTATLARVSGYTVAAKTGTVRKLVNGNYSRGHHVAMTAGVAPAGRPRAAIMVLVDTPRGKQYFGGQVAAPVFRSVAREAMRLLNVSPDDRRVAGGPR